MGTENPSRRVGVSESVGNGVRLIININRENSRHASDTEPERQWVQSERFGRIYGGKANQRLGGGTIATREHPQVVKRADSIRRIKADQAVGSDDDVEASINHRLILMRLMSGRGVAEIGAGAGAIGHRHRPRGHEIQVLRLGIVDVGGDEWG